MNLSYIMMNWRMPLALKILTSFIIFVSLASCDKNEEEEKFIARVNGKYLSERQLNALVSDELSSGKFKSEIITQWVNDQVLFSKAKEEGILDSDEFEMQSEKTVRNLAVAFFLKKYFKENIINLSESELLSFYNKHNSDFAIDKDAYILNIVCFPDRETAMEFRTNLINKDWNSAVSFMLNTGNSLREEQSKLYFYYELNPPKLYYLLDEMNDGESSVVIQTLEDEFCVVQLIKKIGKGSIPDFIYVKNEVAELLMAVKRKEYFNTLLGQLYLQNDVEIFGKEE